MILELHRISSANDSSLGVIYENVDGKLHYICMSLEDEYREQKVMHETRVPAGYYQITLRTWGGFHERYKRRLDNHKGMLWIRNVPGFEYILIHAGNTDDHTSGCILTGTYGKPKEDGNWEVFQSMDAYKHLYSKAIAALDKGEEVTIKIHDIDAVSKHLAAFDEE